MVKHTQRIALERAIKECEGQTALANRINVLCGTKLRQGHVYDWLHKSKKGVPAEYCHAIERITDGQVTAHDLRPDIFPRPDLLSVPAPSPRVEDAA